jgi:hypothetical protein
MVVSGDIGSRRTRAAAVSSKDERAGDRDDDRNDDRGGDGRVDPSAPDAKQVTTALSHPPRPRKKKRR